MDVVNERGNTNDFASFCRRYDYISGVHMENVNGCDSPLVYLNIIPNATYRGEDARFRD